MPDRLTVFASWWLQGKPLLPPHDMFMRIDDNLGITLFRMNEFQVQLFTFKPNFEVVDHRHPGVDSYEVYVGGDLYIRHKGEMTLTPEMVESGKAIGTLIRIKPEDWHGGYTGPRGGTFISIQEWANKSPTSIHLDWEGPSSGKDHQRELDCNGKANTENGATGLPHPDS